MVNAADPTLYGTPARQQSKHAATIVDVTPTIVAEAYDANDMVGVEMEFALQSQSGVVQSLVVTDLGEQDAALELHLFRKSVTPAANNAAVAFTDAEGKASAVGVIVIPAADYIDAGPYSIATIENLGINYECDSGTLFGYVVTRGTPTYGSTSDLTFKLGVLPD